MDIGPRFIPGNQVMRGGFKTREAALAAMHTLQSQVHLGEYVEPTDLTVQQYFERWWAGRGHDLKDSSSINYRSDFKRIAPLIGDIPLQRLTTRVLINAYNKLADAGYKTSTVEKSHLALHIAFKHAVQDGLILRNPAQGAFRQRLRLPETDCLTEAEANQFLTSEYGAREYPGWRVLIMCGVRPGELCALQDRDVDLTAGQFLVRYTLTRKFSKGAQVQARIRYELDDPKTPAGRRRLDVDPETLSALRAYRAARQREQEAMGIAYQDQGYFFAEADGRPWNPNNLSDLFVRRLRKSGVRKVRLYALRHTAASIASSHGVPLADISAMLGHSSIRTTARYLHTLPGSNARAARKIASAIDGAYADPRSQVAVNDTALGRIILLPPTSISAP